MATAFKMTLSVQVITRGQLYSDRFTKGFREPALCNLIGCSDCSPILQHNSFSTAHSNARSTPFLYIPGRTVSFHSPQTTLSSVAQEAS